jgi:hypothetical protein
MTLIVKVHDSQRGKIVCITDSSLIGKKVEEGNKQLDFSSNYYKGEQKPVEIVEKMLTSAYIAVFSGQESVALGKRLGIIEEKTVLVVDGVPHAQCLIG